MSSSSRLPKLLEDGTIEDSVRLISILEDYDGTKLEEILETTKNLLLKQVLRLANENNYKNFLTTTIIGHFEKSFDAFLSNSNNYIEPFTDPLTKRFCAEPIKIRVTQVIFDRKSFMEYWNNNVQTKVQKDGSEVKFVKCPVTKHKLIFPIKTQTKRPAKSHRIFTRIFGENCLELIKVFSDFLRIIGKVFMDEESGEVNFQMSLNKCRSLVLNIFEAYEEVFAHKEEPNLDYLKLKEKVVFSFLGLETDEELKKGLVKNYFSILFLLGKEAFHNKDFENVCYYLVEKCLIGLGKEADEGDDFVEEDEKFEKYEIPRKKKIVIYKILIQTFQELESEKECLGFIEKYLKTIDDSEEDPIGKFNLLLSCFEKFPEENIFNILIEEVEKNREEDELLYLDQCKAIYQISMEAELFELGKEAIQKVLATEKDIKESVKFRIILKNVLIDLGEKEEALNEIMKLLDHFKNESVDNKTSKKFYDDLLLEAVQMDPTNVEILRKTCQEKIQRNDHVGILEIMKYEENKSALDSSWGVMIDSLVDIIKNYEQRGDISKKYEEREKKTIRSREKEKKRNEKLVKENEKLTKEVKKFKRVNAHIESKLDGYFDVLKKVKFRLVDVYKRSGKINAKEIEEYEKKLKDLSN